MDYDVIGDIHGDATRLRALLAALGHRETATGFVAPAGRQAVFVGDLIDRGPEQLEVLDIVRRMVDRGDARCVIGNHELNAVGWLTERDGAPGEFLRPHSEKNRRQHARFLEAVGEGSARHAQWVAWFRTLPVALDLGGLRVVHAWWSDELVARAAGAGPAPLRGDVLQQAFDRNGALGAALDGLTKGHELALPAGASFRDKEGHVRHEVRTTWWRDGPATYREVAVVEEGQRDAIPALPLPPGYRPTPVTGTPVFVGHYWLSGAVAPLSGKVACLDYSGAKGGPLVAYRWRGEDVLHADGFETVPAA